MELVLFRELEVLRCDIHFPGEYLGFPGSHFKSNERSHIAQRMNQFRVNVGKINCRHDEAEFELPGFLENGQDVLVQEIVGFDNLKLTRRRGF